MRPYHTKINETGHETTQYRSNRSINGSRVSEQCTSTSRSTNAIESHEIGASSHNLPITSDTSPPITTTHTQTQLNNRSMPMSDVLPVGDEVDPCDDSLFWHFVLGVITVLFGILVVVFHGLLFLMVIPFIIRPAAYLFSCIFMMRKSKFKRSGIDVFAMLYCTMWGLAFPITLMIESLLMVFMFWIVTGQTLNPIAPVIERKAELSDFQKATIALFHAYIVAGLTEEVVKYALIRLGKWYRPKASWQSIVMYGVVASISFSTIENLLYAVRFDGASTRSLFKLIALRQLLALPLHVSCGTLLACKFAHIELSKPESAYRIQSIILPVFFHGTYDAALFLADSFNVSRTWRILSSLIAVGTIVIAFVLIRFQIKKIQKMEDEIIASKEGALPGSTLTLSFEGAGRKL